MTDRYDITVPKEGKEGKSYFTKIGTAFQNAKGITLYFDALPTSDKEGVTKAILFPAKAREQSSGAREQSSGSASPSTLDDEIPFSASF